MEFADLSSFKKDTNQTQLNKGVVKDLDKKETNKIYFINEKFGSNVTTARTEVGKNIINQANLDPAEEGNFNYNIGLTEKNKLMETESVEKAKTRRTAINSVYIIGDNVLSERSDSNDEDDETEGNDSSGES